MIFWGVLAGIYVLKALFCILLYQALCMGSERAQPTLELAAIRAGLLEGDASGDRGPRSLLSLDLQRLCVGEHCEVGARHDGLEVHPEAVSPLPLGVRDLELPIALLQCACPDEICCSSSANAQPCWLPAEVHTQSEIAAQGPKGAGWLIASQ